MTRSKRKQKRGRYGDGCVYKNGRLWWLAWYEERRAPNGSVTRERRYASSGTDDKKEAQKRLRAKLQEIGGRRPTPVGPEKVTYNDLRENFLNRCVAKGLRSLKADEDGNPTLATLPRLDNAFDGWRAGDITIADLKNFRAKAREDGLSDARCNRYMATLRAMFNQGRKDELITSREVPSYFPMVAEPNEARGALYVEDRWYAPLRKALKEPLRSAFTLAYHFGVRVHEIERIRWRDVNLERRLVTLPAESTKTGRSRTVGLPSDFKLRRGEPDALVFPLGDYRWQWYKACVKVGAGRWEKLPSGRKRYAGILLRHCRHTAVRNMSDAGLDEKRIMEISGHLTRSMFDRYNIGREEDAARSRDLVERFHRERQRRL
ncbi:MAG TPA: tyrosine-type recombinase/integrase [Candidatus Acidoferrum sp.]|nr:tyrosine-type recombinase/integrase [Candidatus Acidoferrum sp.]